MVPSDKYYKSHIVGVTSEVGLSTDRDLSVLMCLRNTMSFIPPQYRKSYGTIHYTTVTSWSKIIWISGHSIIHKWPSPFSGQWLVVGPVNGYIKVYIYLACFSHLMGLVLSYHPFYFLSASWILAGAGKCCYYCCLFCTLEQWLLQWFITMIKLCWQYGFP